MLNDFSHLTVLHVPETVTEKEDQESEAREMKEVTMGNKPQNK
jgi:hypothetical protein